MEIELDPKGALLPIGALDRRRLDPQLRLVVVAQLLPRSHLGRCELAAEIADLIGHARGVSEQGISLGAGGCRCGGMRESERAGGRESASSGERSGDYIGANDKKTMRESKKAIEEGEREERWGEGVQRERES
eukprot:3275857-Pleurochrysis_carterae.AAC.1